MYVVTPMFLYKSRLISHDVLENQEKHNSKSPSGISATSKPICEKEKTIST
jgi:hypothetical protein